MACHGTSSWEARRALLRMTFSPMASGVMHARRDSLWGPDSRTGVSQAVRLYFSVNTIRCSSERQVPAGQEDCPCGKNSWMQQRLFGEIHFPCLRRCINSSGGKSMTMTSSASSKMRSGTVSRTKIPVIRLTMSFRLSRMLDHHGCPYINSGTKQFFDILPAFRMS